VHHSDVFFDASTAFRFHPGEILFSIGIRAIVVIAFGLPAIGILVFELIYGLMNVFEHGNIKLGAPFEQFIGRVFITPALHRKHHSKKKSELDSNFGTIFSFWDRLFYSRIGAASAERIPVGLPGQKHDPWFIDLLKLPFTGRIPER
jgi:sterol desaturase/sphingolipid hydroxylase (fatty acid hydroxylase superfamily)